MTSGPSVDGQRIAQLVREGPVHVVGLGGAGMSALARLLLDRGTGVSGSDARDSVTLRDLRGRGARAAVGHAAGNVTGAAIVAVSSAVREDNPEVIEALRQDVPVVHRSVVLAALMQADRVVCVAGTHGKTTTTSMLTVAARAAGLDPSYAIGGDLVADGVNARSGGDAVFVAEADESDGSFLAYSPDVAVVTNVEADHLDHYGDEDAVHAAFAAFAGRLTPGGLLLVGADDAGSAALGGLAATRPGVRVLGVGTAVDADVRVLPEPPDRLGAGELVSAELVTASGRWRLALQVPGLHNLLDAALAWTAAVEGLGLDPAAVARGLARFSGARRRFEHVGEAGGVRVVDDYAHHPTEVAATIAAARTVAGDGQVRVLFQPHLYSRTRLFAAGFASALQAADSVVVLDVYAAREDPEPGVDGALVADAVPGSVYAPDTSDAVRALVAAAGPGDLVLLLGAGDVTELAPALLAALASAATEEVPR